MLSKASSVYIIMLAVFFGGIYVILAAGSALIAPVDLAGKWVLQPPEVVGQLPATQRAAVATTHPSGPTIQIEQSGRFFQMTAEDGKSAGLKLVDGSKPPDEPRVLKLSDGKTTAVLKGNSGGDEFAFSISAPAGSALQSLNGDWLAHRATRTYPVAKSSKGEH